ncbi:ribosomal RNA small subunit methyltransferase A [Candidatus Aerophobetes bacterium]|uniref:Ribosomal RNA small subunit methyltransferase A n=1 Tax=Aerophobetes bacterium TaxID=2030807 RepID=A0A662D3J9_UNCAE|nr:MAG: ribosomal RNA small subunit methyltransferase A [Candidatus Aerophobetes bacterium]
MKLKEKTEYLWYEYNFTPRRELGQNFLIDPHIVDRIIESLKLTRSDVVLEIGAGTGVLTEKLVQRSGKVVAVEIDERLCELLRKELKGYKNLEIVCEDITKIPLGEKFSNLDYSVKVAGNLPYGIASSLLLNLAKQEWVKEMVVMVQREVAERMLAKPGCKKRGALTVLLNYYATSSKIIDVPPQAFTPSSKVGSSVIKVKKKSKHRVKDEENFASVVKASFSLRRKMLANSLSAGLGMDRELIKERLRQVEIDWRRRAEELTLEEFIRMSESLYWN